jgi:hypothetical protein
MSDNFGTYSDGLESPGRRHRVITPGPSPIVPLPRALYCNGAGQVTITDVDGISVTYEVEKGVLPFRARIITAATVTVIAWE